jgi:iron complex outermembrane receptor protein
MATMDASARRLSRAFLGTALTAFGLVAELSAATTAASLKNLTLEELLDIEVESVSRAPEPASQAAASIHVITDQDIRRSGANSIPEALRLAPNLQVAQTGSRGWAISARGFNASFANKLLVMIDGRTVYSPLFSGVFWDMQDTLLEDIDRIEVISGPGATAWGSNAVNGVINIVTKSARETPGFLATVGAGTEERSAGAVRYGGATSENSHYRVYAKYFDRDDSVLSDGQDVGDAWTSAQAGFRFDRKLDTDTALTIQGDLYDGSGEQLDASDSSQSGGNLLARWERSPIGTDRLRIQTYYDHTHQFTPDDFGDDLDTFDIDTQYERAIGNTHRVMVGAGYRFTHNKVKNLPGGIAFLPATLDRHLFSAFVQDDVSLLADRLKITIGSRFEHNDYTGLEIQPSARAAWSIDPHLIWGAISRAVRTPSRIDRHLFSPADAPFIFAGGPNFDSEKVIAYELGWRVRPREDVFLSAAAFFNDYDDIRSLSLGPPFVVENNAEGEIYGLELEATWHIGATWRMTAGYTLLQEDLRVKPGRADRNLGRGEAFDPQQQIQLRSSIDLFDDLELDVTFRFVDQIQNTARGFQTIPDYTTLDVRVGWLATRNLELAIVGQNLLEERHPELGSREIERSGYAKATWRY